MTDAFFGPQTAEQLGELVRQGFATVLLLADPPVFIQLYRMDEDTGAFEAFGLPTEVTVKYGVRQPDARTELAERGAISQTLAYCEMRAWSPWDVQIGDTFTLGDGRPGRVSLVHPVRFGIQKVECAIDEGSAA